MRIISQDGTTDVPYEHVAVIRLNKKIYFFNSNLITDSQALAEYSTEEKAEKAMEMLRGANAETSSVNADSSGLGFSVSTHKFFQLPKDDEVEV